MYHRRLSVAYEALRVGRSFGSSDHSWNRVGNSSKLKSSHVAITPLETPSARSVSQVRPRPGEPACPLDWIVNRPTVPLKPPYGPNRPGLALKSGSEWSDCKFHGENSRIATLVPLILALLIRTPRSKSDLAVSRSKVLVCLNRVRRTGPRSIPL